MFSIYIIYSESADKYYVGYSENVYRRVKKHNSSPFKTYTSKFRPWVLKASFEVGEDRGRAMKIEKYIKKQKSRKFIEKIIDNINNEDFISQLVRVPFERD
jgi:putative endonuclease